jgi:hypothetical protein
MFVGAALPHPGCGWRVSVLTGSVEEIRSGGFRIHFGPA